MKKMSNETKACYLTEIEIETLIHSHGYLLNGEDDFDERIERMNYLNKRRKAFHEEEKPKTNDETANKVVNEAANQAWPTNG